MNVFWVDLKPFLLFQIYLCNSYKKYPFSGKDINDLLHHSMRVQMATVRDTEFSDFVLSDACISTAGLMFVYFRALGIESRLCTGVQTFNKKPDSDCTPHCWLEVVPGEPLETTFVYVPKARGGNAAFFMLRHREAMQ